MGKQTLDERLKLYLSEQRSKDVCSNKLLLAASAVVGVGAIIVPPPAEAAIVYSGVQEGIEVKNSASILVDFNGDGAGEFAFKHSLVSSTKNYQILSGPGSVSFKGDNDLPDRLSKGVLINDDGIDSASVAILAAKKGAADSYGAFLGNSGYLGVKFKIESNTHYGWIQYEAESDAAVGTIIDWAYENVPNKAIRAGAIKNFNWALFLPAIITGNKSN
jgi:hypothetical protein